MSEVLGRYYTSARLARAVVARLPLERGSVVLEPSSGGGAFLDALTARDLDEDLGLYVHAMDVDARAPSMSAGGRRYARHIGDFLTEWPDWAPPDVIVGNPPYSVGKRNPVAVKHVERALELVMPGGTVAFVLLLQFLGSLTRQPFFRDHPPARVEVIVPRPSFTGGSTDQREYALFTWRWPETAPVVKPQIGWLPCAAL